MTGPAEVHGHQGSDAYNDDLSGRRADEVQQVLTEMLTGADLVFESARHGEREPRVPNIVNGQPDGSNRARNRRVEIVYTLRL